MEDNYQGYDPSQNQTQGQNSDYQQNYGYQNQQNYGYQGQPGNQNQYGYQQGYQYGNQPPVKPSNNLVWAILTTICCCLPFGIVSIVYAAKVDSLYYSGHYEEANAAARKAGTWAVVAAIVGFLTSLVWSAIQLIALKQGYNMYGSDLFNGTGLY